MIAYQNPLDGKQYRESRGHFLRRVIHRAALANELAQRIADEDTGGANRKERRSIVALRPNKTRNKKYSAAMKRRTTHGRAFLLLSSISVGEHMYNNLLARAGV